MKVTQTNERKYEFEFDDFEVKQLKDISAVFGIDVDDILRQSVEQNMHKCSEGVDQIMRIVNKRLEDDHGH